MKRIKESGITLITLVIAVCILIIISSLLVYNAKTGIRLRNLNMMYNDIELLSDKVNSYYTKYGALPAEIEYEGNIYFEPEPNDNDIYYVIDLNALDGISLNYGHDFKHITSHDDTLAYNDIYIINEQSHHIYYARGIEMDGVVYYTNESDDSISIKPIISINLTLTHENKKLNASQLPNVKEITNENVPIPQGFYYVGGTKNEGVVISDIEGDDLDNSKKGNQFVWVPVNQNQKLILEVESNEEIKEIILTQPGNTQVTIDAKGKTYNGELPTTFNGTYEVEVKTETSSKTESKRISTLYAQDVVMFMTTMKSLSVNYNTVSELLEAKNVGSIDELLSTSGIPSIELYMMGNLIYVNELEEDYEKFFIESCVDYNKNLESVNKYGGFYIGRYEAGDGTTTSKRTVYTSDSNKLVVQKGEYVYNYVSSDTAKSLSNNLYTHNTSVISQLITGSAWDRTLNWIIETGEKSEQEILVDSGNWGNYRNSIENASINAGPPNMNYTTGRSEYWKTNNIYDLAGNTWEWSQEMILDTESVVRGGNFNNVKDNGQVSCRSTNTADPLDLDGDSFRVELYIEL